MRTYFGGSRLLVAEDEIALATQLTTALSRVGGATVLRQTTTLSETCALISSARPTIAVLGPLARQLNLRLFMVELFERHLPGLFYVKVPTPLPLLAFNSASVERASDDRLLSEIAAHLSPRGPTRHLKSLGL
jgi:hypothetical protein